MLRQLLQNFEPVRRGIFEMLKPTEIVSLVVATRVIVTENERQRYLKWSREVFGHVGWVDLLVRQKCTITVVGKDLSAFESDIRAWDYSPRKMQLLIVIKHPALSPKEHFNKHRFILDVIEGSCVWEPASEVIPNTPELSIPTSSNVAVIFASVNMRIELNKVWTERLLCTQNTSLGGASNYTWYTNIHEASPSLSKTPQSHSTLSSLVAVLRRHGEASKFLISAGGYKGWTYVATQRGVPLTIEG